MLHAGRPPFRAQSREQAEDFFVASLDQWRQAEGIDKMVGGRPGGRFKERACE